MKGLQEFGFVDYANSMMILAMLRVMVKETIAAIGQYEINDKVHTAEVALVVKDIYQKMASAMMCSSTSPVWPEDGAYWIHGRGLDENKPMLDLFKDMGFDTKERSEEGVYEMSMTFGDVEVKPPGP